MPSPTLDFRNRDSIFHTLGTTEYDVLIIGAGITGCGLARDLAMRGVSTLLVDANDIAAGTSSRSSKLIHGGIRYLAEGHINLVRKASRERKAVRRIAPHLARPTKLIVPGKSKSSLVKFRTGLVAYEKLGQVAPEEKHEKWDTTTLAREEPTIRTENLAGAVVYPEYVTDDARLTLANARDGAAHGAHVITYAPVTSITTENGNATGVTLGDSLNTDRDPVHVRARIIVNAAGPWVDAVRALETNSAPKMMQLTKGIHVTLRHDRLPIKHTVIMTTPDKRSVFVVPRGEAVYFGTTDTFYPDSEYWPHITHEDVRYLLDAGNKVFNDAPFADDDITGLWSGVRPLIAQDGKKPSEISRKDEILDGPAGVLTIAGGKLTAYRSMAAEIADRCEKMLGRSLTQAPTDEAPLPGGDFNDDYDGRLRAAESLGFTEGAIDRTARLYGSELEEVFADGLDSAAEATRAVTHEGALTLEDWWVRRSGRARFDADGGIATLEDASRAMAAALSWSEEFRLKQIEICKNIRATEMQCLANPTKE